MPITAKDEGKDTLGELLNQPGSYDPYQWQAAVNGQEKNRVFCGNVEVAERPAQIPRTVALPESHAEGIRVLENFFQENPDLVPHFQAIDAQGREIRSKAPDDFSISDVFNLAVRRVCQANNLPLEKEAPLPAPFKSPTLADHINRLETERRKVTSEVGGYGDGALRHAIASFAETDRKGKRAR